MRPIAASVALLLLLTASARPAVASCAPPATVAENAERAETVVYGTVTGQGPGSVTLRVDSVLKGSAPQVLGVFVGPGRGGSAGQTVMTSVDYDAPPGTSHVLYLIRGEDGQLETSACIGSHAGAPTAEETARFGPGTAPTAAGPDPAGDGSGAVRMPLALEPPLALAALGLLVIAAAVAVVLRRHLVPRRAG